MRNKFYIRFVYRTNMNNIKVRIYKKVFEEIDEKNNGAEDFINNRIEEICSQEKLSAEEVFIFLLIFYRLCFLVSFLAVK